MYIIISLYYLIFKHSKLGAELNQINIYGEFMFISKELLTGALKNFDIIISEDEILKFDFVAKELVKFNDKINITSINDPDQIVIKHFADSLVIFKYIDVKKESRIIDVGTGGGFPGLPILIYRPDLKITFLDSVDKKLNFVRNIINELGYESEVVHARAEELGHDENYRYKYDLSVSRAMANLPVLAELCIPFVKNGGKFVSYKGDISDEERENGINALKKLGIKKIDSYNYELSGKKIIFEALKEKDIPETYPRQFSKIKKKPL